MLTGHRDMSNRHRGQGQALVEFALVFPIFMLIFFGVVDGARLVYTNSQLAQAAREGARVAAVEASAMGSSNLRCATESEILSTRPGGRVCPSGPDELKQDVWKAVNRMAVGLGEIKIDDVHLACNAGGADPAPTGAWTEASVSHPACAAGSSSLSPNGRGQLVSVRIVYQYNPITPLAGLIVGLVPLSASATMVIN